MLSNAGFVRLRPSPFPDNACDPNVLPDAQNQPSQTDVILIGYCLNVWSLSRFHQLWAPLMDTSIRAIPQVGSATTTSVSIAMTAAIVAGANLAIWFPGESGPDSQSQYAQAVAGQFDDWHPPLMAWLWSILRLLADGDAPMFCFQVVCYWVGF